MSYEQMIEEQEHTHNGIDIGGGMIYATMDEAVRAAGGDTVESLQAESQGRWEEDMIAQQDSLEIRGPQFHVAPKWDDDCPF